MQCCVGPARLQSPRPMFPALLAQRLQVTALFYLFKQIEPQALTALRVHPRKGLRGTVPPSLAVPDSRRAPGAWWASPGDSASCGSGASEPARQLRGLSRSGQRSSSWCTPAHRAPLHREENHKHKEVIGGLRMTGHFSDPRSPASRSRGGGTAGNKHQA